MKKNSFIVRYRAFFLVAVLFSAVLLSCKEDDDDLVKPKTITDVILTNEQFSILREIILSTGMGDALRAGEVTLFAPDNAAFQRAGMTASSITSLSGDSAKAFVKNHILGKRYEFSALPMGKLETLNNKNFIQVAKTADSTITVNGAEIVTKNINADNGIIQVIDSVLVRK